MATSSTVDAITLNCKFQMLSTYLGNQYACVADNFKTTFTDREVTETNGTHVTGKSNDDVKKLYIKKQHCPYLPLNIGSFFKNLEIYYVMNSHVKHLLNGDLDGLDNLTVFDVSHNPIEQLGRDFFKGHSTIEKISFFDCHLKIIDVDALKPLVKLTKASFQYNVCIDTQAEKYTMSSLNSKIKEKCHSANYEDQIYNSVDDTKLQTMSFAQQNAYLIISFFAITTIVLSVALVRIVKSKFNNNWNELKSALI